MITLVMLSWDRIDNVKKLLNDYSKYSILSEIIVFNNNPEYDLRKFLEGTDHVGKLIQGSTDFGLYTRYAAAGLASNDCILYVDDDIHIPESTIKTLYSGWLKDKTSCHGTYGRSVRRGYDVRDVFGFVKIILTRCSMTSKEVCLKAFQLSSKFRDLESIPKGNGEDIILSYAAILVSGKLNISYRLPTTDLPGHKLNEDGTASSIHKRWPGHYQHRQKVVNLCEQLIQQNLKKIIWKRLKNVFSRKK